MNERVKITKKADGAVSVKFDTSDLASIGALIMARLPEANSPYNKAEIAGYVVTDFLEAGWADPTEADYLREVCRLLQRSIACPEAERAGISALLMDMLRDD